MIDSRALPGSAGPRLYQGLLTCAALFACAGPETAPPPDTRVETVVDVYHGVEFADDYRWLEQQDSPETRAWIARQNTYADEIIGQGPALAYFRTRLGELVDRPDVGSTQRAGDFEYFPMRRVGEPMSVIYRRPYVEDAEEPTVDDDYEVVLDPATFDPNYRTPIAIVGFDPDGTLMLYSMRQGGADEVEIRIRDLETGEDLPDRLPDALYQGVRFDAGGTGIYYTHRSRTEGPRIRHHTLGHDPAADREIWGSGYGPTAFISMDSIAGGYTIYRAQHGWARDDLFIQEGDGPIRPIVENVSAHFRYRVHDGSLYILTDWMAPNYRLIRADLDRPTPDDWVDVIPEGDAVLENYAFVEDEIYATYLQEVAHRVQVFTMDGTPAGEVEVPEHHSVQIRAREDGKATLTVTGYLTPSTEYEIDLETGERVVSKPPEIEVDGSQYALTKLWFSSTDGARAPVYVMHRAGIDLDGTHPTILNGYGGFNVSIRPSFSTSRLAWLDAGGVYAVATLRGGAEFGEDWHRAGMLENKQQVFDDFISAAERLIEAGFTDPDHLAINGGSNGGLLVASAMTQRPELFRAVLCTYPDLDMVRFFEFTETNNMPALLEYGDARNPDHFAAIRQYSPYQAVRDGVRYPAVMLATGDLDTRVPPLQARKMAARLQAATASDHPVILTYDERGGHAAGRGRPTGRRIEDTARELAFLAQQLGLQVGESAR